MRTDDFDLLLGLWGLWTRIDDFDSTLGKCGLYLQTLALLSVHWGGGAVDKS